MHFIFPPAWILITVFLHTRFLCTAQITTATTASSLNENKKPTGGGVRSLELLSAPVQAACGNAGWLGQLSQGRCCTPGESAPGYKRNGDEEHVSCLIYPISQVSRVVSDVYTP